MAKAKTKRLKITQTKSSIGYHKKDKRTLHALGLRKMHQTVVQPDNPAIRGMVARVRHLVKMEE